MKDLLSDEDGWYAFQSHPQQHYFFKSVSLCGMFKEFPDGAHHDNDPLLHCKKCQQKTNKLMAVASSIAGKKLSPRDVMNLLEALEKIELNKGAGMKVKTPENVVAVVGHPDDTKTTIEVGERSKNAKNKKKQK